MFWSLIQSDLWKIFLKFFSYFERSFIIGREQDLLCLPDLHELPELQFQ